MTDPLSLEALLAAADRFERIDRLVTQLCVPAPADPDERTWLSPLVTLRKLLLSRLLDLANEAANHTGDLT